VKLRVAVVSGVLVTLTAGLIPTSMVGQVRGDRQAAVDEQIRELLQNLLSEDKAKRESSVKALSELGEAAKPAVPELVRRLGKWNSDEWAEKALVSLGPVGAEAVPELRKILRSDNARGITAAARVLASIGEAARPAVPDLRDLLKDPYPEIVWRVALALGDLGPVAVEALPDLIKAIEGGKGKVRRAAVCAMEGFGPLAKDAVPGLAAALSEDELRFAAAVSLKSMGSSAESAVPALIETLKEHGGLAVMEALGCIGAGAVPALVEELSSTDPTVQMYVAWALGLVGRAAVPSLVKALESEDRVLREGAAQALMKAGPAAEDAIPALTRALADMYSGHSAAHALAAIGDAGVRSLLGALKSENEDVCDNAAFGLAAAKEVPQSAAEDVLAVLRDGPVLARGSAAEVLGNMGYEKAVPTLVAALDEEYVDDEAKAALLKIGPVAVPCLLRPWNPGLDSGAAERSGY